MSDRQAGTGNGLWLVAAACLAATLVGCRGGGAGATESPAGPASVSSTATALSPAAPKPSATVSAADLADAKEVVRRPIAAVNNDRFDVARSLMVDPDRWWSLGEMRAIRSIHLRRVTLMSVDGTDSILLQTDLERDPAPQAGGPEWPNFMLLVRDPSGGWRVAQTATGP